MRDFAEFQVLTFDCYGTLIDWESGLFAALRPILARHGKNLSDARLLELYGELEAREEQGEFRPYREVLQSVVRAFGQRLQFSPTEAECRALQDSVADWKPFADTVPALGQLKAHYRLGILSNIDDDLFAATGKKLEVKFDLVVTAQQAGAYKPSQKFFRVAQERTGVSPEHWLHVGQSIYHDVIPAQALGLSTVWVKRPSPRMGVGAVKAAAGKPDWEVPDMKTLADLAFAGTARQY
jgi:2-haloacid dehalogenase